MKKNVVLILLSVAFSMGVSATSFIDLGYGFTENIIALDSLNNRFDHDLGASYGGALYIQNDKAAYLQVTTVITVSNANGLLNLNYLNCTITSDSCTWYSAIDRSGIGIGTHTYVDNFSTNTGLLRLYSSGSGGHNYINSIDSTIIELGSTDYSYRNYTAGFRYIIPVINRFKAGIITYSDGYATRAVNYTNAYSTEFQYSYLVPDCDFTTGATYYHVTNTNQSNGAYNQYHVDYQSTAAPELDFNTWSPFTLLIAPKYIYQNETIQISVTENNPRQLTGIGWYIEAGANDSSYPAENKIRNISYTSDVIGAHYLAAQLESTYCDMYPVMPFFIQVLEKDSYIPTIPTTTTSTSTSTTTTIVPGGTILNMIYPSSNNSVTPCDYQASFYGGLLGAEYLFESYTDPSYGYEIDYPLTGYGNYYMDVNNIENGTTYEITAILQQYPLMIEIESKTWNFTANCGIIGPTTTTTSITTTSSSITTTTTLPGCIVIGVGTVCQSNCANQYNGGNCTIVGAIDCINSCPINNETTVTTFTYPTVTFNKIIDLSTSVNETDCSNYTKMAREGDYAGQAMCAYSSGIGTPWVIGFLLLFVCGSTYRSTKNYSATLIAGILTMASIMPLLPMVYRIFAGAIVALLLALAMFTRLVDGGKGGGKGRGGKGTTIGTTYWDE